MKLYYDVALHQSPLKDERTTIEVTGNVVRARQQGVFHRRTSIFPLCLGHWENLKVSLSCTSADQRLPSAPGPTEHMVLGDWESTSMTTWLCRRFLNGTGARCLPGNNWLPPR